MKLAGGERFSHWQVGGGGGVPVMILAVGGGVSYDIGR